MIIRQERHRRIDPATGTGITVIETTELVWVGPDAIHRVSDTLNGLITERPATINERVALETWDNEQAMFQNTEEASSRIDTWAYVLRDWAQDADNVVAQWDTATNAQKDAWMKTTIDRLGQLADHLADLIAIVGVKRDA